MPKLPLQIILEFDREVDFDREVIGKSFNFYVKDYKGKLSFPNLSGNEIKKPDILIESLFEDHLSQYNWGKLDHECVKINSFLLTFEINEDMNIKKRVNDLFWIIKNKWFQNLKEHIEISKEISFNKHQYEVSEYTAFNGVNAKINIDNKVLNVPILPPPSPPTISLREFHFDFNTINLGLFKYIVKIISDLQEVPTELSLINKARTELNSNPRRAIIDCSTALEITLTKICRRKLLKNSRRKLLKIINEDFTKDLLENKYRTLGNKLNLALLLKLFDDDGYKEDIVSIRNNIIHKGFSPSKEQAKTAYEKSSRIIKEFSDLNYFSLQF